MKPQIITQDAGIHNSDLNATRSRILRGGSWKKQRIVVILPMGETIPARVALSHWNLIFPPNQGCYRMLVQGMEVGEAYSNAIEQILANPELSQWEYILTLEHDNVPPQDGVIKLLEHMEAHPEYSVISGGYFTKGFGGVFQAWGDPTDPVLNFRPQAPRPGELMEVIGTGQGFALWRISMFKDPRLRRPWFKTIAGKEGVGTQDLYFFGDARKYGYKAAVACDVPVGHYDHVGAFGPPETIW